MIQDIKTRNIKPIIRERIRNFTKKLMQCPEIEGIVYLGGLANTEYKDFLDEFSDIDLGIFINCDRDNIPEWLQPFSFYIPVKDDKQNERMVEVNLHQQILNEEEENEWSDTKREAYSYASEIVFDRNGRIEELIKEKTKMTLEHKKAYLAHLFSRIHWNVKINPTRAIERGFELNAEELLNQGVENMLELIFVYNDRYPPHPKWRLAMIENLPICPKDIKKRVVECMKIKDISKDDVMRRRKQILEIVAEIERKLKEENIFISDENYSDYEYFHWKPQKQLKETTIYDLIVSDFPQLSLDEREVFKGLLCEFFIHDIRDLYEIPRENLSSKYQGIIDKIIYYDPKTKELMGDFIRFRAKNDPVELKKVEKALQKRKIKFIENYDGNLSICKLEEKRQNDELLKE